MLWVASLVACSGDPPANQFSGSTGGAPGGQSGAGQSGAAGVNASTSGGNGQGGAPLGSGGALASSTGGDLSKGGTSAGGGTAGASAGGAATSGGVNAGGTSPSAGSNAGGTLTTGGSGGANSSGAAGRATTAGTGGQSATFSGTPTEKALAKLAAARQEHSVVAAAGEVYVIGGYNPNPTDSVQAYNPGKDSWRSVKKFPATLNHGNAGVIADKIYVAGFYINNGMSTATTDVYAYDPASDNWTAKSPLPTGTARAAACVAVDAGLMYVFGGAHDGMSVNNAARYDAAADKWEELPPLPERREHCAAGAINGILYVAGGRADGITGIEAKTWSFDPAAKTWTERAPLPTPRGGLAGAVLRGHLVVFGGEGNSAVSSGVFPNIDAYDPTTNTWQAMGTMLVPRHGFGAATLDDRIYLPGGAIHQGAGGSDEVSVFYFP